ncbi:MAG: hypothetical protein E6H40_01480 [Betaproteobacteria bacterium]|nr:MAG: hypothetical protein E6H40_01480 [Betaproteobacteria bacterium]
MNIHGIKPYLVAGTLALAAQTADAWDDAQFRCPAGQAIQGVDVATHTLICIPVSASSADIAALVARVTALESEAANERNARLAADNALQANLSSEAAARAAADTTLQGNINAEAITRIAEDGTTLASAKAYTDTKVAEGGGGGALSFLQPYISLEVNPINGVNGPHIIFSGANVHVRSGSGRTDDNNTPTGLGNLIVGYDEQQTEAVSRTGSHNLIVGGQHSFTRYGGLAAGAANTLDGVSAFAAGVRNVASGDFSSVTGGAGNFAGGGSSSISGGQENMTVEVASSVTGGRQNTASGVYASVTGGFTNAAAAEGSSVSGGQGNVAFLPFQHVP